MHALLLPLVLTAALSAAPFAPAEPKTIDFDAATVADLNAAFDAGTLTAEKLVQLCLARIQAYDRQGPSLHAVITLNAKALDTARELDVERKSKGPRSPLHGIPVVLKDNYDTSDMPTTGGSILLEGWVPPEDAFVVKKLRAAGAIILAKLNMSEFASGGAHSSLGGQSLNPHDLVRTPSGSSGGTGVAIAAAYATIGMGTDGPMARSVYDVAVALGVMTGVDPADAATSKSTGKAETDYTKSLKLDALKGARIGVARDFLGADPDVDWVVDAALAAMKHAGATLVDVRYPKWLLDAKGDFYTSVRYPEFRAQIAQYLSRTPAKYPKTIDEMIERSNQFNAVRTDGAGPNPSRWNLFKREAASVGLDDYRYTAVRDFALPMIRATVEGMFATEKLDAIVYPTSSRKPGLIAAPPPPANPAAILADMGLSATDIANLTGFPDLIVPAGFTGDNLPVGLSFFGLAFSESKLLALGFSFEQATHARRLPVHTPPKSGEKIAVR